MKVRGKKLKVNFCRYSKRLLSLALTMVCAPAEHTNSECSLTNNFCLSTALREVILSGTVASRDVVHLDAMSWVGIWVRRIVQRKDQLSWFNGTAVGVIPSLFLPWLSIVGLCVPCSWFLQWGSGRGGVGSIWRSLWLFRRHWDQHQSTCSLWCWPRWKNEKNNFRSTIYT